MSFPPWGTKYLRYLNLFDMYVFPPSRRSFWYLICPDRANSEEVIQEKAVSLFGVKLLIFREVWRHEPFLSVRFSAGAFRHFCSDLDGSGTNVIVSSRRFQKVLIREDRSTLSHSTRTSAFSPCYKHRGKRPRTLHRGNRPVRPGDLADPCKLYMPWKPRT